MAVQDVDITRAQQIGRCLAELLRDEPSVRQIWVWIGPGGIKSSGELAEIWVFLHGDDEDVRHRVGVRAQTVQERFPGEDIFPHLVYGDLPDDFDGRAEVEPGAIPIESAVG